MSILWSTVAEQKLETVLNYNLLTSSLYKIQSVINNELRVTANTSYLYAFPYFHATANDCTEKLLVSKISNKYSINELLIWLKSEVIFELIFGQNFELKYMSSNNWPRIEFKRFEVDSMWFVTSHPPTQTKYIACGDRVFQNNNSDYAIFFASFRSQI